MVIILGQRIVYDKEMDSTNNRAKLLAKEGAEEGTVVITERQTQGKGRLGRTWQAPEGTSILMSLLLRPTVPIEDYSQLSIVSALTLCETLKELTGLDAKIKWPNDIVIHQKKVCGILMELCHDIDYYLIVGIGMNVSTPSFPSDLPYATSLFLESGKTYDRKEIIQKFLQRFEADYKTFLETKNIAFLKKRYEENCITLHKTVKLIKDEEERIAYAKELTKDGKLCVQYSDDTIEAIGYGEISVRGLYGYI